MRAQHDGTDDPNALFLGRDAVAEAARALAALDRFYFVKLLGTCEASWASQSWLYEPLTEFLSSVGRRGKAIVMLWSR